MMRRMLTKRTVKKIRKRMLLVSSAFGKIRSHLSSDKKFDKSAPLLVKVGVLPPGSP